MASTTLSYTPLALGQHLLSIADGQVWKVTYREVVTRKTLQLILATSRVNVVREVTYVYECECEETDDGRLVFQDQLGFDFIILDQAESSAVT